MSTIVIAMLPERPPETAPDRPWSAVMRLDRA